jgi:hypothetical protein
MARRPTLSAGLAMVLGIIVGGTLSGGKASGLLSHGGDRRGESVVLTGPVASEIHPVHKSPFPTDAVYYLNYSTGRLFAAVPAARQTAGATQVLTEFADRDLVEDFRLAPDSRPHFLMTIGAMGVTNEGWAPLYVFETTTGRVCIYRVVPQFTARSSKPTIALLERRGDDARLAEFRPGQSTAAMSVTR